MDECSCCYGVVGYSTFFNFSNSRQHFGVSCGR
jgi:hypothetical protein